MGFSDPILKDVCAVTEHLFYHTASMMAPYAELHCHTNFSFLDGAAAPDELVERAVELGLSGMAVTDHLGLYGVVRFSAAAEAAGLHPVIGTEVELLDAAVPDPERLAIPARRPTPRGGRRRPPEGATLDGAGSGAGSGAVEGRPGPAPHPPGP